MKGSQMLTSEPEDCGPEVARKPPLVTATVTQTEAPQESKSCSGYFLKIEQTSPYLSGNPEASLGTLQAKPRLQKSKGREPGVSAVIRIANAVWTLENQRDGVGSVLAARYRDGKLRS